MSSTLSRVKLYTILLFACFAGYAWVIYNLIYNSGYQEGINTCIIKQVTTIPCPSCGTTRAIMSIANYQIMDSLYWNPLGFVLVAILIVSPIWIAIDLILKKKSLYSFYGNMERFFRNRWVAILSIILILTNWIWNIQKGL